MVATGSGATTVDSPDGAVHSNGTASAFLRPCNHTCTTTAPRTREVDPHHDQLDGPDEPYSMTSAGMIHCPSARSASCAPGTRRDVPPRRDRQSQRGMLPSDAGRSRRVVPAVAARTNTGPSGTAPCPLLQRAGLAAHAGGLLVHPHLHQSPGRAAPGAPLRTGTIMSRSGLSSPRTRCSSVVAKPESCPLMASTGSEC